MKSWTKYLVIFIIVVLGIYVVNPSLFDSLLGKKSDFSVSHEIIIVTESGEELSYKQPVGLIVFPHTIILSESGEPVQRIIVKINCYAEWHGTLVQYGIESRVIGKIVYNGEERVIYDESTSKDQLVQCSDWKSGTERTLAYYSISATDIEWNAKDMDIPPDETFTFKIVIWPNQVTCLLYTSPSPRDRG